MKNHRESGIALITTLLILLMMSTMIVGLTWLVMGDQKLGGNNSDRQLAYYAAEAGMEQLTASLENAFDANYALNATAVTALETTPGPPSIQGVQYLAPGSTTNGSGYIISFNTNPSNTSLPASNYSTIPSGTYAGLVGLMTPYTLQVTAHTGYGSEVRLQREVQTIGIPVFQFGIFSQTDLSFFAGPNFNFGGRVHTNGNLWLAEGDNSTLTLGNKVTAVGQIITSNLENGWNTSTNYTGAVDITTGSSLLNLTQQTYPQSVSGTTNSVASLGSYVSGFGSYTVPDYNSNIGVGNTGVTTLNLSIATPAIGGQPIDLIRRPVAGEDTANAAKLAERYYSQTSVRILLSDYGASGTCTDSDISSTSSSKIPELSTNLTTPATPIDLATLAWTAKAPSANSNTKVPYYTYPTWLTTTSPSGVGYQIFPLPVSYAQNATYTGTDGYWVAQYYPIITGCIKIDYQTTAGGAWTDVTPTILNLGWTGRNIDPQVGSGSGTGHTIVPNYVAPTSGAQPNLAGIASQVAASGPTANTTVALVGCTDPSPNAIIRLARLRDNPSNATKAANNFCGSNPSTGTWSGGSTLTGSTHQCWTTQNTSNCPTSDGTDYWPNVLFDTREGLLRDVDLATSGTSPNGQVALAGAMYYVELDVANLATWLSANSTVVNNTTGYSVYFSDRRGEQKDTSPPASVGTSTMLTGGFGYDDFVNPNSASGCPSGALDQGEDVEGDFSSTGVDSTPLLRTYGNILSATNSTSNPTNPSTLWPIYNSSLTTPSVTGTEIGGAVASPAKAVYNLVNGALVNNPSCTGPGKTWPFAVASDPNDLRENPPIFYRRALKLVNGSTISLGTCNSVPCGLTIVSENPVYIQGDYNNPGLNTGFTGTGVGASVVGDAVTLLSDNWNDVNSFAFPYLDATDQRVAADTTYRVAIAGGKGIPFVQPTVGSPPQDFGTDGGTHNFLRYIEDWGGGQPNGTLYYQGSIVSMYYNHQGVGTYKCCTTVYSPPTRAYQFDSNFLTPSELPPLTPMLRLVNTIGYTQMILPTQ